MVEKVFKLKLIANKQEKENSIFTQFKQMLEDKEPPSIFGTLKDRQHYIKLFSKKLSELRKNHDPEYSTYSLYLIPSYVSSIEQAQVSKLERMRFILSIIEECGMRNYVLQYSLIHAAPLINDRSVHKRIARLVKEEITKILDGESNNIDNTPLCLSDVVLGLRTLIKYLPDLVPKYFSLVQKISPSGVNTKKNKKRAIVKRLPFQDNNKGKTAPPQTL